MKNFPFEAEPFELEVRRAGTPSHAEEESYDREKAIRLNRCMSEWLGWIDYRQEIYALLGFPRTCPTEAALADAVRRWQQERRMTADGILGLQTLNSLHAPLGRPALAAEPARPAWMRWEPSPNFSSRDGRAIDTIVLHATGGGSVQGALQRFKNRKGEASAHFVILRNGVVLQMVELSQAAWHTSSKSTDIPGMNQRSIGIEIVNPGARKGTVTVCDDESGSGTKWTCARSARIKPLKPLPDYYRPRAVEKFVPFSEPQYRALLRLLRFLISCIPTVRLITGHEHLHKWHGPGKKFKNRVDPGGQFDWARVETALAETFPGVICHRLSRLNAGTNRLNPAWREQCAGLPALGEGSVEEWAGTPEECTRCQNEALQKWHACRLDCNKSYPPATHPYWNKLCKAPCDVAYRARQTKCEQITCRSWW
jgi:N-acetyl-anhydromuramyl-L-alanine amidase AmpD